MRFYNEWNFPTNEIFQRMKFYSESQWDSAMNYNEILIWIKNVKKCKKCTNLIIMTPSYFYPKKKL